MSPEHLRMYILTANVCSAPYEWLGVCDEHEQHWTGWKYNEVEALGEAHQNFWRLDPAEEDFDEEDADDEPDFEDDGGCNIYYVRRS